MARFRMQYPKDVLDDLNFIGNNCDDIWKAMTRAGATVVMAKVLASVPPSFHDSNIMHCLKLTRDYYTPSDDGFNTKVAFYGYFTNKNGQSVPAPLICNLFEYGRSDARKKRTKFDRDNYTGTPRKFPKHPFMRKAFHDGGIKKAMLQAQEEASKGILK